MGKKNRAAKAAVASAVATTPPTTEPPTSDVEREALEQAGGGDTATAVEDTTPPAPAATRRPAPPRRKLAPLPPPPAPDVEDDEPRKSRGCFSVRLVQIRNKHTKQTRELMCPVYPPNAFQGALKPGDVVTNGGGKGQEQPFDTEAERDEALAAYGFGKGLDPLAKNELGPEIPH